MKRRYCAQRSTGKSRTWTIVLVLACAVVGLVAHRSTPTAYKRDSFKRTGGVETFTVMGESERTPIEYCAVTTTIFQPNEAIARVVQSDVGKLIVVGDLKTNSSVWVEFVSHNRKVEYLSPERQTALGFSVLKHMPWNHFARKSLGYLRAIQLKCETIFDFDDDNHLIEPHIETVWNATAKRLLTRHHVYNPYPYFEPIKPETSEHISHIWPRGFPLQFIGDAETFASDGISPHDENSGKWRERVAVVQSLANHNPDVDAVYRMSQDLPIDFKKEDDVLLIPSKTFVPWNAQATLLTRHAFFALLLPASVPGRVSDIWRSYVGTRVLWDTEYDLVAFSSALVRQFRNPHSYMEDFKDEQDLYNKVDDLLLKLARWTSERFDKAQNAYLDLIELLVRESFLAASDLKLAKAWVKDLHDLGYEWPALRVDRAKPFLPMNREVVDDRVVDTPSAQHERVRDAAKVSFVLSTRVEDHTLYEERLRLHFGMFADPRVYSMTLVLDEDVRANHFWAANLSAAPTRFTESIKYASLPTNHQELFDGAGRGFVKSPGYDRNQWNNFHSDEYADADANILAIVDSDTCIHTFMTKEDYLTKDGKLILHASAGGSHWAAGDSLALGFVPKYDLMWTDVFPIFFWSDTFIHVREEIADRLGNGSFATAYKKFNRAIYSQFNIIGNWALQNEPTRYEVIVHKADEHARSVESLTLGAHKQHGWCTKKDIFADSCAVAFGIGETAPAPEWRFEDHDARVKIYVQNMDKETLVVMKRNCENYLADFRGISCDEKYECVTL